jgi:Rps23 Pro-64 3,4-dihydroxylase Tpa1-like proline 4-hydroxylase
MRQFCFYTSVLGARTNTAIHQMAVDKKESFEHSRVVKRGVDRQIRASTVLYDDRLTDVVGIVQEAVLVRLGEALHQLGIPEFDVGTFEIQLTSHNDGEFFHRHTDAASRETASRMLTFVYYFHSQPKGYTGGELVFFDGDGREGS